MRQLLFIFLLAGCGGADADGTSKDSSQKDSAASVGSSAALNDLAFFQAVEVPLLLDGVEVGATVAPLIVGKDAILRAKLLPSSDLDGLQVSVSVASGGASSTFVSALGNTAELLVELPASAIVEGATFSVSLSDDGTVLDRFPETGEAALPAVTTGPLAVRLVPFTVNGFTPDTSSAVLEGYRAALQATFPVTDVQLSVAEAELWEGDLDLGAINERVGEIQEAAMGAGEVAWNVYYYGMVSGVATRDAFEGITGTSEGGGTDDLVRAYFAAGAAFGDQKSEDTFIHEIGHTHGLLHTPCDGEEDPDPDYPYPGGVIGVEGYDFRTAVFVSADTPDLMSYCFPRWVSDYNYVKLAIHVANAQGYEGYQ